jgi:hypothetical protein
MDPILTQRYYEAYPEVPELSGRAGNSKLYSFWNSGIMCGASDLYETSPSYLHIADLKHSHICHSSHSADGNT